MNLLPEWVPPLQNAGWSAVHWSSFEDPKAEDQAILGWPLEYGHVVLTHDLDFRTALAPIHACGPSLIQIRSQHLLLEQAAHQPSPP
jgi:predicted nuclease of predicted toxin-antitoxin system